MKAYQPYLASGVLPGRFALRWVRSWIAAQQGKRGTEQLGSQPLCRLDSFSCGVTVAT